MVLSNGEINIIADMERTSGVKLHNNRQKLRARFDIVKKLGQGTYGKVQLAINKDTGQEVAIKTIKKSKIETEQDLVRIQREIQIMSSVQHPHIIHIYEVFENREKIVLVMEYANGGELYDYLSFKKVLEEHEARRVFRQVAAAVFYCHKNMICHRDLKLENILLDEKGNAKIADFGLSNIFDQSNFLHTFCGSPLYASPEIVQGTPYYGPEVDCWSLGVLLYTLVYGAMPFDGSNFKKLVKQISEGIYYEPNNASDASALIRKMLTVDPAKRANIDDICIDVWVDTKEEIPLWDIAQEMCKQMPVRLDYLLALTSLPPSDLPPEESLEKGEAERTAHSDHQEVEEDEDEEQWERPALQALQDSTASVDKNATKKKRNEQLASSSSMSVAMPRKKQRGNDENDDDETANDGPKDDHNDDDDKGGQGEVMTTHVQEVNKKSKEAIEPMEADNAAVDQKEDITHNEGPVEQEKVDDTLTTTNDKNKVAQSSEEGKPSSSTMVNITVKRKPSVNRRTLRATSAATLTNGISIPKKSSSEMVDTTTPSKPAMSKLALRPRKSLTPTLSKDPDGSATVESPKSATAPRSAEKRPSGFAASVGSRVSDARKTFEARTSSVDATTSRKRSPPLKQVGAERTKSSIPSKTTSRSNSLNVEEKASPEVLTPRQMSHGGRTQSSRMSPAKAITPKSSVGSNNSIQLHHHSCIPMAEGASLLPNKSCSTKILTKKKSPPPPLKESNESTLSRKNSLTKTASITSAAKAREARGPPSTRSSGANSLPSRNKSPVKGSHSGLPAPTSHSTKDKNYEIVSSETRKEKKEKQTAEEQTRNANHAEESSQNAEQEASSTSEKHGSIEIVPVPASALVRHYSNDNDNEINRITERPTIKFIPRNKAKLTLLGVKSEVMFDVEDASTIISNSNTQNVTIQDGKDINTFNDEIDKEEDSKIIRYIATIKKHGSNPDADEGTESSSGPERVTLLKLRCAQSGDTICSVYARPKKENGTPVEVKEESLPSTPPFFPKSGSRDGRTSVVEMGAEQRGYSVYRSKYRSVQKYRSIVERRQESKEDKVFKEEEEEKEEVSFSSVDGGSGGQSSEVPTIEHCDSFSSTGSTDDLEDVFESLTSEHLFTSLLSRTRSLIDQITEGDAHAAGWFQSSFLRGRGQTGRLASHIMTSIPLLSCNGNGGASFQVSASPSGVSYRINQRTAGGRPPPFSSSATPTRDLLSFQFCVGERGNRAHGGVQQEIEVGSPAASSYLSESSPSTSSSSQLRQWSSRFSGRDAADDGHMTDYQGTKTATTGNSTSKSSSSAYKSSSINEQSNSPFLQQRQSRYDVSYDRSKSKQDYLSVLGRSSMWDSPSLIRHKNRSLGARNASNRPQSLYGSDVEGPNESDDLPPPPLQPLPQQYRWWSSSRNPKIFDTVSSGSTSRQYLQRSLNRGHASDDVSSSFTQHRPSIGRQHQRYSKSVSKELSEEIRKGEGTTSSRLHRPRSMLVLTPEDEDNANKPEGGGSSSNDPSSSVTTINRDYSKSISHTDEGGHHEEEEEIEQEHCVTEQKGSRKTTTKHRECRRSISRTQESHEGTPSSTSGKEKETEEPVKSGVGAASRIKADECLSRQDSGFGSMYDSIPSTPTVTAASAATGTSNQRGAAMKFARSISSELKSLEEEIDQRMTQGLHLGRDSTVSPTPPPDGSATPTTTVSDGMETSSVCSNDDRNAFHQHQRASEGEEESVGERIRRKSYFQRFNESQIPHRSSSCSKGHHPRASPGGGHPQAMWSPSSENLSRASSLRQYQQHLYDDQPYGHAPRGHQFFQNRGNVQHLARCGSGGGDIPPNQRWSMHYPGGSELDDDGLYESSSSTASTTRSSQERQLEALTSSFLQHRTNHSDAFADDESINENSNARGINRTYSLPEESLGGRPVFRQHSMPSSSSYANNGGRSNANGAAPRYPTMRYHVSRGNEGGGRGDSSLIATSTTSEGPPAPPLSQSWHSCSSSSSSLSALHQSAANHFRPSTSGSSSSTSSRRNPWHPHPLDAWEEGERASHPAPYGYHQYTLPHDRVSNRFSSIMDSLDSPREVLQKTMELCDSLRFS